MASCPQKVSLLISVIELKFLMASTCLCVSIDRPMATPEAPSIIAPTNIVDRRLCFEAESTTCYWRQLRARRRLERMRDVICRSCCGDVQIDST